MDLSGVEKLHYTPTISLQSLHVRTGHGRGRLVEGLPLLAGPATARAIVSRLDVVQSVGVLLQFKKAQG